jgi:hypothetical protein
MIFFSNKSRPYHLGPYPLERIARDAAILERELGLPRSATAPAAKSVTEGFGEAVEKYHQIFHELRDNQPVSAKAPVPDDLERRMIDVKGSGYFLNASQIGICELADSCWLADHSGKWFACKFLGGGSYRGNGRISCLRNCDQYCQPYSADGLPGPGPR